MIETLINSSLNINKLIITHKTFYNMVLETGATFMHANNGNVTNYDVHQWSPTLGPPPMISKVKIELVGKKRGSEMVNKTEKRGREKKNISAVQSYT